MKNRTVIILLSVLAVMMYTVAVINFSLGYVLGGLSDVLMACALVLMAYSLYRVGQLGCMADTTRKALIDILEQLTKGVPATLTLKDGKGILTIGHDEDPGETPEDELTEDEKRVKRMAEEYDQLAGRYERLTNFLASDKFKTLSEKSCTLLEQQNKAMGEYMEALQQRIQLECDTANKKD